MLRSAYTDTVGWPRRIGAGIGATVMTLGLVLGTTLRTVLMGVWYLTTAVLLGIVFAYRQMRLRARQARFNAAFRLYRAYRPLYALIDGLRGAPLRSMGQGFLAALCALGVVTLVTVAMRLLAAYHPAIGDAIDFFWYAVFPIH